MKKYLKVFNDNDSEKHVSKFKLDKNAMHDEGKGRISFGSRGLTITDNSEQWSGTKYDIKTLDINTYNNQLTADHSMSIEKMIGRTEGVHKIGNRVVVDAIQFAVDENPLALYAYNMVKAGYLTDFSTETIGPWPNEDGVYENAQLVGLSLVVAGNNKASRINEIARNSIEEAEKKGLDTSELREITKTPIDNKNEITNNDFMLVRIKNTRNFKVTVKFTNQEGKEEEVVLDPGATVDVPQTEGDVVEKQVDDAKDPNPRREETEEEDDDTPNANTIAKIVKNAVKDAVAPLKEQIITIEKEFNTNVQEPQFIRSVNNMPSNNNSVSAQLKAMNYKEIHAKQINAAWDGLKGGNTNALRELQTLNDYNLEKLKEAGKVANSVTISDMGNFVISPELLTDIEGFRSDFQAFLGATTWRDTLSLQMAWLSRSGDINMQEVEMCDDGEDGNLKPISEYGATLNQSNLMELAAVTPVCDAATRFLAVDLLQDVAEGYRTDFDRKKAQLVIARLQQAVNSTGNSVNYSTTTGLASLQAFIRMASEVAERAPAGTFVFNQSTYYELLRQAVAAGISTDTGMGLFTTGTVQSIVGRPYIVVPNELMPTLNVAGDTKSFVVEGVTVTINKAIFYGDLRTFTGRTSGGLKYDLSTEAAYEDGGQVKSAFQRNELILRGSFFRGGAVRDPEKIAAMGATGVS